ncbi:hypothetical protein ACU4GD_00940 [Cupriavidus basilensis]
MKIRKILLALLPLLAAATILPARAATDTGNTANPADTGNAPGAPGAVQAEAAPMTDGEIRKVDAAAGKPHHPAWPYRQPGYGCHDHDLPRARPPPCWGRSRKATG